MRLRSSAIANYLGQFYMALLSLALLPIYLRELGAEAYGFISLTALLQAGLQVFDFGISGALARKATIHSVDRTVGSDLFALFQASERFFIAVGVAGALMLAFSCNLIVTSWLGLQHMSKAAAVESVLIIALILPLRWQTGLYRAVLWGRGDHVWVNGFSALLATARFVLVLPILFFISNSIISYLLFQLVVSLTELGLFARKAKLYFRDPTAGLQRDFDLSPLKIELRFSLGIGLAGLLSVLITQSDKIVVSSIVSLETYGYFAVGVSLSAAVNLVAIPIVQTVQPKLIIFEANNRRAEALGLYRLLTQSVCILVAPIALCLALFSHAILLTWTGDPTLSKQFAPVLALYSLGNGIMAIAALPYTLQFAMGKTRYNTVGMGGLVLIIIPSTIVATIEYGPIGAGAVWLFAMLLYLLLWTGVVHRKIHPGMHITWILQDILLVVAPAALIFIIWAQFYEPPATRLGLISTIFCLGVAAATSSLLVAAPLRKIVFASLKTAITNISSAKFN